MLTASEIAERHNAGVRAGGNSDPGGKAGGYVKRFAELFEQQKTLAEDARELGKEAKAAGYDGYQVKALKTLAKRSIEDEAKREKREAEEAALDALQHSLSSLFD